MSILGGTWLVVVVFSALQVGFGLLESLLLCLMQDLPRAAQSEPINRERVVACRKRIGVIVTTGSVGQRWVGLWVGDHHHQASDRLIRRCNKRESVIRQVAVVVWSIPNGTSMRKWPRDSAAEDQASAEQARQRITTLINN